MQSVLERRLPEEITRAVESFYHDDEFTRQMPGEKDRVASRKMLKCKRD